MANVIWKYPFEIGPFWQQIQLPGSTFDFAHAGLDPQGTPCVWLRVDTDDETQCVFEVRTFATGEELPGAGTFVETFFHKGLVWHLFARPAIGKSLRPVD